MAFPRTWLSLSFGVLALLVACHPGSPVTPATPKIRLKYSSALCLQQCDAYGSCSYPTVTCGDPTCDPESNQVTTSTCADGLCAVYEPVDCADGQTCSDAGVCAPAN